MIIRTESVPGTSRQRVIKDDGSSVERQAIYMQPHHWDALKVMANKKRTSGSIIIARLIEAAVKSEQH